MPCNALAKQQLIQTLRNFFQENNINGTLVRIRRDVVKAILRKHEMSTILKKSLQKATKLYSEFNNIAKHITERIS